jgi:hypothetical protein
MSWKATGLIIFVLLIGVSKSYGFDGKRRGLILGGGLGIGVTVYDGKEDRSVVIDGTPRGIIATGQLEEFSTGTNLRVGWGINDRYAVYALSYASWFNEFGDQTANAVTVLALQYYLGDSTDLWYLIGGAGVAAWLHVESDGRSPITGPGALVGVGYHWGPHFAIEGTVTWGSMDQEVEFGTRERDAFAFMLSFTGLAF